MAPSRRSGMRKRFSNEFRAKVALAALKGDKTMSELASEFGVHPTQVSAWRNELKSRATEIFGSPRDKTSGDKNELIEELYKNLGQMKVEHDWLKKKLHV